MIIECPFCGARDLREFSVKGAALPRPAPEADDATWHDYVHLRDNPAGASSEFWQHSGGCGSWLVVSRNTITHAIERVVLAQDWAAEERAG